MLLAAFEWKKKRRVQSTNVLIACQTDLNDRWRHEMDDRCQNRCWFHKQFDKSLLLWRAPQKIANKISMCWSYHKRNLLFQISQFINRLIFESEFSERFRLSWKFATKQELKCSDPKLCVCLHFHYWPSRVLSITTNSSRSSSTSSNGHSRSLAPSSKYKFSFE